MVFFDFLRKIMNY